MIIYSEWLRALFMAKIFPLTTWRCLCEQTSAFENKWSGSFDLFVEKERAFGNGVQMTALMRLDGFKCRLLLPNDMGVSDVTNCIPETTL